MKRSKKHLGLICKIEPTRRFAETIYKLFLRIALLFCVSTQKLFAQSTVPITGENFIPVNNAGFLKGLIDAHFIPQLIKFLLIIAELAAIGIFIYHGATFVFASGEEQKHTNARNGMLYALVGITFIAAAYAIVQGVIKLDFFNRAG